MPVAAGLLSPVSLGDIQPLCIDPMCEAKAFQLIKAPEDPCARLLVLHPPHSARGARCNRKRAPDWPGATTRRLQRAIIPTCTDIYIKAAPGRYGMFRAGHPNKKRGRQEGKRGQTQTNRLQVAGLVTERPNDPGGHAVGGRLVPKEKKNPTTCSCQPAH